LSVKFQFETYLKIIYSFVYSTRSNTKTAYTTNRAASSLKKVRKRKQCDAEFEIVCGLQPLDNSGVVFKEDGSQNWRPVLSLAK